MGLIDRLFGRAMDKRIAAYQNDLIARQVEEVEHMYRQVRGWRHDYHHHIQTLAALAEPITDPQAAPLRAYLDQLSDDLTHVDTVLKTGNVMVDAILNSKLSLAKSRGIAVNARAYVPDTLAVSDIDLCAILGNLLDNAIEACMRLDDASKRLLRVYMDVKRDSLYLSVTNTSGPIVRRNGRYPSAKGDGHGFGLMRVDRLVDKYGGYLKRRDAGDAFTSEILLPL